MLGGENSILENQMQSASRPNGGSFIIRLYLSYMRYFFCVAGSGELDAIFSSDRREVTTVGTLQYFLDLCLKTRYYY